MYVLRWDGEDVHGSPDIEPWCSERRWDRCSWLTRHWSLCSEMTSYATILYNPASILSAYSSLFNSWSFQSSWCFPVPLPKTDICLFLKFVYNVLFSTACFGEMLSKPELKTLPYCNVEVNRENTILYFLVSMDENRVSVHTWHLD